MGQWGNGAITAHCLIAPLPHYLISLIDLCVSSRADIAQLVERLIRNQQVISSSLIVGSIYFLRNKSQPY